MPTARPVARLVLLACSALSVAIETRSPVHADAVTDIVITEVMYHAASDDKRENFIEIYNQSAVSSYNLKDWTFEDGVGFTFPDVTIGPRQYLVVCADQTRIRQLHGITNTVGNWDPLTGLDRGGERLRLLDAGGVEVEDLTYDDRNPWPILADGYGRSLEKRNPAGDNDDPANWAASAGTSWSRVTVTGLATSSTLYIYLDAAGTAYVDDVQLYPVGNPGDNRIQNPGFENASLSPWDPNGNHSGSTATTEKSHSGTKSLKVVATGAGSSSSTAVVQSGLGLITDAQYTLEFWVFLTAPGQRLICRLSGSQGAAEPIYVETGGGGATPGRENSVNTGDIPPFVYPVLISPETPAAADAVTILAVVADDRAVTRVTAHWDSGSGEQSRQMFDDGAHGDGVASDGVYGSAIGTFPTGSIVHYYVTAEDDHSPAQTGRFPFIGNPTTSLGFYIEPAGVNPSFIARSNTGLTSTRQPVYHLLVDEGSLSTSYIRGTFIFNGEVFEDVRVRYRGQSSLGTPKKHLKVDFNKDHRFRTPFDDHPEVDNINIQSSYGDKAYLREWLSYKGWMDAGRPGLEMWHVVLYMNGAYRGVYVSMENADNDWMARTHIDPDGWLWKSYSEAKGGTGGFEPEEMAGDAAAANAALGTFMSNVNTLTGQGLVDYINANMDVGCYIDFLAVTQLIANADHPAKNYFVYADEDSPAGTWTYLPWDMDLTHGRNFECAGGGVYNDTIRYDMFGDPQLLFGTAARPKCDGPWNGVINAFLNKTTAFRARYYARTGELLNQLYRPEVLIPIIDDMSGPLTTEVNREWALRPFQYGGNNTNYAYHVQQLRGWVRNRYNYLSGALTALSAPDLSNLACARAGDDVNLTWKNNSPSYDSIRVYRDEVLMKTLSRTAVSTTVPLDLTRAVNTFRVASVYLGAERPGDSCTVIVVVGSYVTVVNEDFSPPASSADLSVNCNAVQLNGLLQLTEPVGSQAGTAFFRNKFPDDDFIADFDLRFDEPGAKGADGLVFALIRGDDPTLCGAPGGALGFWAGDGGGLVMSGYALNFDTWQNAGEVSDNWVGFIDTDSSTAGSVQAANVPEEFTGQGAFHVTVLGKEGTFIVTVGNSSIGMAPREVLSHTVPGFAKEDVYFGFTAGTGGAVTRHIVDNFVLQVKDTSAPPVVSDFRADRTSGEAPLTVVFSNLSTGAASYAWDFGDGSSSTDVSPPHNYQRPGKYTVTLVADGPGGTDTEVKAAYIDAALILEADFIADRTVGGKPLSVKFSDRTRTNVDISSYAWDFGDGSGSTSPGPTHSYSGAGRFTVALTVTEAGGGTSSRSRANYILVDDVLDADFTADKLTGTAPLTVQFSDSSQGTTTQTWAWSFGDGGTSAVQDPQHTFALPGKYSVSLVVSGFQAVDSAVKTDFIVVLPAGGTFIRGDANGDAEVDISDAISILTFMFNDGPDGGCQDASDVNDDGALDISDPIGVLGYLFQAGEKPRAPFPGPGQDLSKDDLPECVRGG